MFREPLTDHQQINRRAGIFRYFGKQNISLPFSNEEFGIMENYLRSPGGSLLSTSWKISLKKIRGKVTGSAGYSQLQEGCAQSIRILQKFREMVLGLELEAGHPFAADLSAAQAIFGKKQLQWLTEAGASADIPLQKLIRYDHCLRGKLQQEMKKLLQLIFRFDLYIAVSRVAVTNGFTYAEALPSGLNLVRIEGLRHPMLKKAVGNDADFSESSNMLFLTGANMAGKSTFMKSFGLAVYLAHMGFPVAAGSMQFSVKDGIFTSINVPDNLEQGFSHFYAEVLRVKAVAEAVDSGKNLLIIFDELFKGTNVKDAYEATQAITEAFSRHRNCQFIISTHIIEVAHALIERAGNIRFRYMPTIMQGNIPQYTYKMQDGISSDRQGMMIIGNEKILELIGQP
jgi:hypothetical protein